MTPPTIRPATIDDVAGIADVHVRAWQWAYRGLMPDEFLDGLDPSKRAASWLRVVSDDVGAPPFLAVDNGEVVGFCHAASSRDDDALPTVGEVTSIYLLPDHIGTGTGYALWCTALDYLRSGGHASVTVWVLDSNQRGRAFYERVGMAPDGATNHDDRRGFAVTELRYRGGLAT